MTGEGPERDERRGSVAVAKPFVRIRIIAAVVVFLFALLVVGYRSLSG